MPNKLSRFWQELKRRKVVHVITVYAGVAFVIIELINNVTEPLSLPEWTPTLVITLLLIGFPIAVIFSWIYDIHPEGGIVKTKPAHKVKPEEEHPSSNSWKIASYISFIVIVGLIVLNIIPRTSREKVLDVLDKSIAVLPFRNDSPDEKKMYFINGTMEAILDNLCKIEDMRVVSRNSVEQYRNNPKPTPVVAEEMNVSYILEGSGHRDGNHIRLFVQLLDGRKDEHLWSKSYDADIEEIFALQSEIAQLVAGEIEAIITPREKELIEKVPTSNLVAYEFYQIGLEEYWKYRLDRDNLEALRNAERQYKYALDYDSTFSLAYTGLAEVYWDKNYWKEYFTENFMDSAVSLANKALSFDPQLSEAYVFRGRYNYVIGDIDASVDAFNKALSLNPNSLSAYSGLSNVYFSMDMILEIDNLRKAILLNREAKVLPSLIRSLGNAYSRAGFPDIWEHYMKEALELDGDSVTYLNNLIFGGSTTLQLEERLHYAELAYKLDSTNLETLEYLGQIYFSLGNKEEALIIYNKLIDRLEELEQLRISAMHRVGYVCWLNGMPEEANYYFDLQIDYCINEIKLNRPNAIKNKYSYYDLACVYAFRGETQKALEYLREYNQKKVEIAWIARLIKNDPLFGSIDDEPEFQQIVRDVEAKYQAEHERVRQWLEENNISFLINT